VDGACTPVRSPMPTCVIERAHGARSLVFFQLELSFTRWPPAPTHERAWAWRHARTKGASTSVEHLGTEDADRTAPGSYPGSAPSGSGPCTQLDGASGCPTRSRSELALSRATNGGRALAAGRTPAGKREGATVSRSPFGVYAFTGGPDRDRTGDLLNAIPPLVTITQCHLVSLASINTGLTHRILLFSLLANLSLGVAGCHPIAR
jgi:hypothetical protein